MRRACGAVWRLACGLPFMAAWSTACLAALLAAQPAAAAGEAEPPCTLVVGQGRNFDAQDHEANTAWNQLNNGFNAQVAGRLQDSGERVLRLPLPVEARDIPSNVRSMLERAQDAGCDRILETTIFADDAAQRLVVRLRAYPLLTVRDMAGSGALLTIGEPGYTSQRDMRLLVRSLDQLSPPELAREMVADFVRQKRR